VLRVQYFVFRDLRFVFCITYFVISCFGGRPGFGVSGMVRTEVGKHAGEAKAELMKRRWSPFLAKNVAFWFRWSDQHLPLGHGFEVSGSVKPEGGEHAGKAEAELVDQPHHLRSVRQVHLPVLNLRTTTLFPTLFSIGLGFRVQDSGRRAPRSSNTQP
jgi:hypothetical protein